MAVQKHSMLHPAQIKTESPFMGQAIDAALEGIKQGDGGPFGCVIVKDGTVVGTGHNCVLRDHDATAHGEVMAIREAGKNLGTHDLSDCVAYTTGEPCPMCLYACLWANIQKVYYGCTIEDNSRIGFRDEDLDKTGGGRVAFADYLECIDRLACLELFDVYMESEHELY